MVESGQSLSFGSETFSQLAKLAVSGNSLSRMEPRPPADRFLEHCVRCCLRGREMPGWPDALTPKAKVVSNRIAYHGIALMLLEQHEALQNWPGEVVSQIEEEGRLQALWEISHQSAIANLIEALASKGITPFVLKGTAMAYSVYDEPAMRRRGDTDLLIEGHKRNFVRDIFRACGWKPVSGRMALQEAWTLNSRGNFVHAVDLHWTIRSSMAVSEALANDHPKNRAMALPRLSANAMAFGPADSMIQVCLNSASHSQFGYLVEEAKIMDGQRLIWAVDLDSLTSRMTAQAWDELERIAVGCGASALLAAGLSYAQAALQTQLPEGLIERLEANASDADTITSYYRDLGSRQRITADIMAAAPFQDKFAIFMQHAFPNAAALRERFPESEDTPTALLHARRIARFAKQLLRGSRT